ncbi:hypothetical protein A3C91_03995 [Candidatus Azambacteria bacterium RIFCSPHIGHO2_02_FULL_52_12]|uniref:Uncharacterized protein n=1 Tax=Candidatus Azambacteria bacterium RIFCSPLOWO2_01_FULL_46_25 TaxID=1797298 RepID=A0A1F5BUZ9_9BACT|nr:MAG: hypothetical protein A3C91_03995 [Candidatus Azambacteria bacterium RIFCSPHIGHO2_02_FULL_52_12]OGD34401.1 MAG: hypothetical protein A2988_02640 [Candidatus Azambacteria bacterium RIFCSPLOWO2_01_FULL_46_25]OGD37321.1 MAG: hypothetical protein A2850_01250 [Candidatus Azambacteria bacterium RIFCSPHIGHO2_01_FULL_51_74]
MAKNFIDILYNEAFFTGTAAEMNAIANIGAVIFNKGKEGPVTRAVKTAYLGAVKESFQNTSAG